MSEPDRVIGYFAISTAVEQRNALASAKFRRGMPEQVPLLLIGRLAVDAEWRGCGIGSALLIDALRRCLAASQIARARGGVAHAIDEVAVDFYERHGFVRSPKIVRPGRRQKTRRLAFIKHLPYDVPTGKEPS